MLFFERLSPWKSKARGKSIHPRIPVFERPSPWERQGEGKMPVLFSVKAEPLGKVTPNTMRFVQVAHMFYGLSLVYVLLVVIYQHAKEIFTTSLFFCAFFTETLLFSLSSPCFLCLPLVVMLLLCPILFFQTKQKGWSLALAQCSLPRLCLLSSAY